MQWFVAGEAPVCSLSIQLKHIHFCTTTQAHESRELTKMDGRVFSAP